MQILVDNQAKEAAERERQIQEHMRAVNQQKAAERRASQTDESVTKRQWVSRTKNMYRCRLLIVNLFVVFFSKEEVQRILIAKASAL